MERNLKFINIPFEVKADSKDELIIEGYGAVKNNIDSYKDVIVDGAFTKTIKEQGDRIAFCYQHDIWNPIGKILEISEDEKGLRVKVKLSQAEGDIKTKIREGILKEMSIGYSALDVKNGEKNGEDVLFLTEIKLYEISLVTIAANEEAIIESMKADGKTTHEAISVEFDRVIALETKDNTRYELMKLKALIMSLPLNAKGTSEMKPPKAKDTDKDEPLMTSKEMLKHLI